jgi:hypothetical protein
VETNFVQTPRTGSNVTQILPTDKERIAGNGIRTGGQFKGSCHEMSLFLNPPQY